MSPPPTPTQRRICGCGSAAPSKNEGNLFRCSAGRRALLPVVPSLQSSPSLFHQKRREHKRRVDSAPKLHDKTMVCSEGCVQRPRSPCDSDPTHHSRSGTCEPEKAATRAIRATMMQSVGKLCPRLTHARHRHTHTYSTLRELLRAPLVGMLRGSTAPLPPQRSRVSIRPRVGRGTGRRGALSARTTNPRTA